MHSFGVIGDFPFFLKSFFREGKVGGDEEQEKELQQVEQMEIPKFFQKPKKVKGILNNNLKQNKTCSQTIRIFELLFSMFIK